MFEGVIRLRASRAVMLAGLVMIGFLAILPLRTIVAGGFAGLASLALDDPDFDGPELASLPQYQKAVRYLRNAEEWEPGNALYPGLHANVLTQVASWKEVMETLGASIDSDASSSSDERKAAENSLLRAISLEPSSPGNHFALAGLRNNVADRAEELEKAVRLYPRNSQLRYSVALVYLLQGNKTKALDHARILAASDDSYFVRPGRFDREAKASRSSWYLTFLGNSYLYKALEIAWRTSGRDKNVVLSILPNSDDAKDVLSLFYESKGIEE